MDSLASFIQRFIANFTSPIFLLPVSENFPHPFEILFPFFLYRCIMLQAILYLENIGTYLTNTFN